MKSKLIFQFPVDTFYRNCSRDCWLLENSLFSLLGVYRQPQCALAELTWFLCVDLQFIWTAGICLALCLIFLRWRFGRKEFFKCISLCLTSYFNLQTIGIVFIDLWGFFSLNFLAHWPMYSACGPHLPTH